MLALSKTSGRDPFLPVMGAHLRRAEIMPRFRYRRMAYRWAGDHRHAVSWVATSVVQTPLRTMADGPRDVARCGHRDWDLRGRPDGRHSAARVDSRIGSGRAFFFSRGRAACSEDRSGRERAGQRGRSPRPASDRAMLRTLSRQSGARGRGLIQT